MGNAGSIPPESANKKGKLTAAFVRTVNRPGVYGDEHGLRLRVYEIAQAKVDLETLDLARDRQRHPP